MIRSGAPFNPMWRTPPPPLHIDTFNLNSDDYLHMVSSDGHRFIIHGDCARVSPLIRKSLADQTDPALPTVKMEWDTEGASLPTIHFPTLSAPRLEVLAQYFYYKHRYEGETESRPPFNVPVESALDVIKVASALQC